jgi:S-(hydroxymethyl)glutathione dehydrogenase/alcohol dehydrogenase
MKAVLLTKLNSPLEVSEVKLTSPKVGQVVVKNVASGLCGSQLLEIKGEKNNAKFLPHLMGHEGCGIVQEVGDGVTKVKQGDKVVMHWMKSNGIESDFPSYIYNEKTIRSGKVTTLSEYSIVSENRLTVVPADTNPEVCALLGCSLTTALGVINNDAEVKFGESVVVLGCGGVGLNLIRGAKMAGAYPIIGVDTSDSKETISKKMGCSHFVNIKTTSLTDIVGKNGADVIIDTTGNVKVMRTAIPMLSDFGRFIMVGHPSKEDDTLELISSNHMFGGTGKTIKASQGGQTNPQLDIPRYVKLFSAGLIKIDELITHRFDLNQINDAIDALRTGNAGRIIIKCHE